MVIDYKPSALFLSGILLHKENRHSKMGKIFTQDGHTVLKRIMYFKQ